VSEPRATVIRSAAVVLRAVVGEQPSEWTLYDPEDEVVIGRGSNAGWRLAEPLLSRRHLHVAWRNRELLATDLESRNGSRNNGAPLRAKAALAHGDRLQIGPVFIEVELCSRDPAAGRPAGETEVTRIAPASRSRRGPLVLATAGVLGAATLFLALVPSPAPRPSPRSVVSPPPGAAPAPRPRMELASRPVGMLRRDAIRALCEGRRRDALHLFAELREQAPDDLPTATVVRVLER
jgi:predicted component of type VI protein secretion system